jgi:hypothetical protein
MCANEPIMPSRQRPRIKPTDTPPNALSSVAVRARAFPCVHVRTCASECRSEWGAMKDVSLSVLLLQVLMGVTDLSGSTV